MTPTPAPLMLSLLLTASLAAGSCSRAGALESGAVEPTPIASSPSSPSSTGPDYCRDFPDRCHDPDPCPPIVIDASGATSGGCSPITWICCGPGGCVALHAASPCGDGELYWLPCEAGESAVDPLTGDAVVICHD